MDTINEFGLAIALTFIYPTITRSGFNAGMLVRYLLEKCKTVDEFIYALNKLPIASQQTLTIADKKGNIAVIECNCEHIEVILPNEAGFFVTVANEFTSDKMKPYNNYEVDDWKAEER